MLERFIDNIKKEGLPKTGKKVLLAVSGGVDSMVLWQLFEAAKLNYEVAHVNFSLRGEESDADEALIAKMAKKLKVQLHVKKAATKAIAAEKKLSIQMAAREIRYNWFDELLANNHLAALVTAHHLNDSLETLFINLNRGTGLKGLSGISSSEKLIRPLLSFTKEEIRQYASANQIEFREDQSNQSNDYERNWFRHELIAKWEAYNPQLLKKMQVTFNRLQHDQELLADFLKAETSALKLQLKKGELYISDLLALAHQKDALFFLLQPLGFNETQVSELLQCILKKEVGKQFESPKFHLVVDREKLFISELREKSERTEVEINADTKGIDRPLPIAFSCRDKNEFLATRAELSTELTVREGLDFEQLEFPLSLRTWLPGDWMIPLGMKGKKKISDILVDEKVPLHKKNDYLVLCSGENIVCLLGVRIDDRFKIKDQTKQVFQLEFSRA